MSIPIKIKNYFQKNKVKHEILEHKTVYTAYDAAQTLKAKIESIVKPLLVKVDQKPVVVVIPAHYSLDLEKVKKLLKAKEVILAKEAVMTRLLKTKAGTLTAFGSLYHFPVAIDRSLTRMQKAIFSAGSFTESVRMKLRDFQKIEQPIIGSLGKKKLLKKKSKSK